MKSYQTSYSASMPAPEPSVFAIWIGQFLGKYWFQIILILLGLHLAYNKDVSVRVNISPVERMEGEVLPRVTAASAALQSIVPIGRESSQRAEVAIDLERSRKLVERFAKVAMAEREKFHLPVSVILAQAILGSDSGTSAGVKESNNYFGHPGQRFHSAWESFREHSKFMRSGQFESLQSIPLTDYKAWAKGLQKSGFSDDKNYARNLVRVVEALDLDQFDRVL